MQLWLTCRCSLYYKNLSKIHFIFLIFLKYSVWSSTIKTRRVNVLWDITVRGFISEFMNSAVILPLLLFFFPFLPKKHWVCLCSFKSFLWALLYFNRFVLVAVYWRICCRHIFFQKVKQSPNMSIVYPCSKKSSVQRRASWF